MNLHILSRVPEEFVMSHIFRAFENETYWENSPILQAYFSKNKMTPEQISEWVSIRDEEMLELKKQLGNDFDDYHPFIDHYGAPSMINKHLFIDSLRLAGVTISKFIQVQREREVDVIAFNETYAEPLEFAAQKKFLSPKSVDDMNFIVYRWIRDPLFYATLLYEYLMWNPVLSTVSYIQALRRGLVISQEQYDEDLTFRTRFVSGQFLYEHIEERGIRSYVTVRAIEISHWMSVNSNVMTTQFINRSTYITAQLYGLNHIPVDTYPREKIDWDKYRNAIAGINWRTLPEVSYHLEIGSDLLVILECIFEQAQILKTKPACVTALRYLYSPGSMTSRTHLSNLEREQKPRADPILSASDEKKISINASEVIEAIERHRDAEKLETLIDLTKDVPAESERDLSSDPVKEPQPNIDPSTPTSTSTPSQTSTPTPTPTPSQTQTPTQTPSQTPTPTPSPTSNPSTPTPTPSQTPTPSPTSTQTPTSTPTPSQTPTSTPTSFPTSTPTSISNRPQCIEVQRLSAKDLTQCVYNLLWELKISELLAIYTTYGSMFGLAIDTDDNLRESAFDKRTLVYDTADLCGMLTYRSLIDIVYTYGPRYKFSYREIPAEKF